MQPTTTTRGVSHSGAPVPSPAAREAREDEGRRFVEATRDSALSDKNPAGRALEPSTESVLHSAGAGRTTTAASKRKSSSIDVRYTEDEREAVVLRAKAFGVTPSAFVRAVVLDALDGRGARVPRMTHAASAAPQPELATAVEQVRRVGVNLNQALRRSHVVDTELLNTVLDAVNEVRRRLGDRTVL